MDITWLLHGHPEAVATGIQASNKTGEGIVGKEKALSSRSGKKVRE